MAPRHTFPYSIRYVAAPGGRVSLSFCQGVGAGDPVPGGSFTVAEAGFLSYPHLWYQNAFLIVLRFSRGRGVRVCVEATACSCAGERRFHTLAGNRMIVGFGFGKYFLSQGGIGAVGYEGLVQGQHKLAAACMHQEIPKPGIRWGIAIADTHHQPLKKQLRIARL